MVATPLPNVEYASSAWDSYQENQIKNIEMEQRRSARFIKHQYRHRNTYVLAVITFIYQFRHFLLGRKFLLRTDHGSLKWLFNFKDSQDQLARWLEVLSQYDFEIQHRPGSKHQNADAFSRKDGDSLLGC
jgi:hypothetical protein